MSEGTIIVVAYTTASIVVVGTLIYNVFKHNSACTRLNALYAARKTAV